MKKLIVLLMAVCLVFCGCSKEEPKTAAPTTEPTQEATTTEPAKEAKITEAATPTISDDELLKEIYDEIDDAKIATTQNNYDAMVSATNIALADESVLKEVAQLGDGYIDMGPDGIKFDNIGPEMQKAIENTLGNLSDLKFYQKCSIKVGGNGVVYRESPEQEELYIKYVKGELDKTPYKDTYDVEKDGYVIVIKIWQDGLADKIASLQAADNKDEYESIKSELGKIAKDFDDKVFDYKISYCHTAFYLINDKLPKQYLIAWVDGEFHSEDSSVNTDQGDNPTVSPTPNASVEENETKYVNYIKYALDQTSYKDHYKILSNDYSIIVQIWQDGFDDMISGIIDKDDDSLREGYNDIKSEYDNFAKSLYSSASEYHVDKEISLYILNDNNLDNLLLAWKNGKLNFEALMD